MEGTSACPYDFKPLTKEEHDQIKKYQTKDLNSYVRIGPKGYVLSKHFLTHAAGIHNLPLRPDDVFVVSYPRSGTTWSEELVWLISNDLDVKKAKTISLQDRFPFLEYYMFFPPEGVELFKNDAEASKIIESISTPAAEILNATTSQRFIKSHLPISLLPTNLLDVSKVVYVARDMRDVAVSVYHFYKANKLTGIECDFKEYYENVFSTDLIIYSPFFEHIKEAWALKEHPNLLFIFYEELSKDLMAVARRVADFFGKQYSDKQLEQLCDHLAFDNFQKNNSVKLQDLKQLNLLEQDKKNNFIRKGKAGGWHDHFDEKMTKHAEEWITEQLRGSDLNFPQ